VTSERTLYVGIVLPGQLQATPAGILKLVRRDIVESGTFAYGLRYLAAPEAVALNPDHLPLRREPFDLPERRLRDGGALPLTLRDALPDAWGRAVLEAAYGKKLDDLDALLLTNRARVGALVFAETLPFAPLDAGATTYKLADLADAARRLEYHMEVPATMCRLLDQGGTLGGARPKANFIHNGSRHIAKFAARDDAVDVAILEAATLSLASACGIRVPPCFIQQIPRANALVVERFDRCGPLDREQRIHYLSAAALLDIPYESSDGSYAEFAQALRRLSAAPSEDLPELFRRMVFNIAVDNCDDHIKNHGVLHVGNGRYRLAPAFDLVPQLHNIGYQQFAILPGRFDAHLDLVRQAAPHFGMVGDAAERAIAAILEVIKGEWQVRMKACGADDTMLSKLNMHYNAQLQRIGA
jgi:serine/threonine-protein kinase HipA